MALSEKKEIARVYELQKQHQSILRKSGFKERKAKLKKLLNAVNERSKEIEEALYKDFRKSPAEGKLIEVFNLVKEIKHAIRHLKEWMEPEQVYPPITFIGSKNRILFEPKGVVLIIAPWNYPFLLALNPLVSAIAAGNCAILKPSGKTPHTSAFIKSLLSELFDEREVAVFEGGGKTAEKLLEHKYDHIFFTGGIEVGRSIMKTAAESVTSITLELGGKSPAIVERSANMHASAQSIIWGKFLNAGQMCIAPDYVLVHKTDEARLLKHLEAAITKFYGDPKAVNGYPDLCEIVDKKHTTRIKGLIKDALSHGAEIKIGNTDNNEGNFISPLVLTGVTPETKIFKEEIFGPVLPVITYETEEDLYRIVSLNANPLSLYVFSKNKKFIHDTVHSIPAGGVTVNGVGAHFANPNLPFGGINTSGIGKYHGYHGFKEFSNQKAFTKVPKYNIMRFVYPPYTKSVRKLIDLAVKYF